MQGDFFDPLTPDQALLQWAEEGVLVGVELALAAGADPLGSNAAATKAAIRHGHGAVVERLLASVFELPRDLGLLELAIMSGQGHLAGLLLPRIQPGDLRKPLHAAVATGDLALVSTIARQTSTEDDLSHDTLLLAAREGHVEILNLLMGRFSCPSLGNGLALKAAAERGHEAVVGLLLPTSSDKACHEAFEAVLRADQVDLIPRLLCRVSPLQQQRGLEVAAQAGAERSLAALLRRSPTPAQITQALVAAVKAGQAGTTEQLLAEAPAPDRLTKAMEAAILDAQWALGTRLLAAEEGFCLDLYPLRRAFWGAPEGFFDRLAGRLDVDFFVERILHTGLLTEGRQDLLPLIDAVGLQVDPHVAQGWTQRLGGDALPQTAHRIQTVSREVQLQAIPPAPTTRAPRRRS